MDWTGGPSWSHLTRTPWRDQALCFPAWDLWFSDAPVDQSLAAATCDRCPVRRECLTLALVTGEEHGIWAGTTPQQRGDLTARLRAGEALGAVLDRAQQRSAGADGGGQVAA